MRRLIDGRLLMAGVLCCLLGCGASGTDQQGDDGLTMALVGFSGENIDQADFVTGTTAQVDLCQDLCQSSGGGGGGQIEPEPFTSTFVDALFVNRGKADIVIDSYSVFSPDSGVPSATRNISARLIGGRCTGADTAQQCAIDSDCGVDNGRCVHVVTPVTLLLYDFGFKERVIQGSCPIDLEPLTLDTKLVFTGSDESGEDFSINAGYTATYDNFDNCEDN